MSYAAPEALLRFVENTPRDQSVNRHGFVLNTDWWRGPLTDVPGGPVLNDDGTQGSGLITRSGVFKLADDAHHDESGEAALRLLWHSLHWGTNNSNRGNRKRIKSVSDDPRQAGTLLRAAAVASVTDAAAAFRILKPGLRPAIKHLGPGFLTKFLYFAGGGNPAHPCLIVDSRVLETLNRELDGALNFKYLFGYGLKTYVNALTVLEDWAIDASTKIGRPVAGDEVERWAFGR